MAKWHVSKGESRIVIAIPAFGFVIKCARVPLWPFKSLYSDVVGMGKEILPNPDPKVRKIYWEFVRVSIKRCLRRFFKGIAENWNERTYYKHTDALTRLFLQPTHLSVFGIANIQRYGEPAKEESGRAIYRTFYKVAGQALVHDSHHWTHAWNFHHAADGPKALDYGNRSTQKVISDFGFAMYRDFEKIRSELAQSRNGAT